MSENFLVNFGFFVKQNLDANQSHQLYFGLLESSDQAPHGFEFEDRHTGLCIKFEYVRQSPNPAGSLFVSTNDSNVQVKTEQFDIVERNSAYLVEAVIRAMSSMSHTPESFDWEEDINESEIEEELYELGLANIKDFDYESQYYSYYNEIRQEAISNLISRKKDSVEYIDQAIDSLQNIFPKHGPKQAFKCDNCGRWECICPPKKWDPSDTVF
jgi:sulfur relay (sulfurtransferase) DsrC/TusE family protein